MPFGGESHLSVCSRERRSLAASQTSYGAYSSTETDARLNNRKGHFQLFSTFLQAIIMHKHQPYHSTSPNTTEVFAVRLPE